MPPSNRHPQGGVPPPPKRNQKVLSLILKAVIMTLITTLFFLILGVASILLLLVTAAFHRRRHSVPPPDSSDGFSRKDLRRLPQFRFWRETELREEAEADCAVCLEGIGCGQWCRKLPVCGHVFHRRCVDAWLVKASSCPVCRSRVRVDFGLVWDRAQNLDIESNHFYYSTQTSTLI